ncbi:hypothetical protein GCM10020295_00430 [Streptomyces cinereospinus]
MSRRLLPSDSVTEGHPDKIADQISDIILDALLRDDPAATVAVETLITTGQIHVAGEVMTSVRADRATGPRPDRGDRLRRVREGLRRRLMRRERARRTAPCPCLLAADVIAAPLGAARGAGSGRLLGSGV